MHNALLAVVELSTLTISTFTSVQGICQRTLESGIVVLVGKLFRNNKGTGGNKRTGGKNSKVYLLTQIHAAPFFIHFIPYKVK